MLGIIVATSADYRLRSQKCEDKQYFRLISTTALMNSVFEKGRKFFKYRTASLITVKLLQINFLNTLRPNDETLRLSFPIHMNALNGCEVAE